MTTATVYLEDLGAQKREELLVRLRQRRQQNDGGAEEYQLLDCSGGRRDDGSFSG